MTERRSSTPSKGLAWMLGLVAGIVYASSARADDPVLETWSLQQVYFGCRLGDPNTGNSVPAPCQLAGTVTTATFNPIFNDTEVVATHLTLLTPEGGHFAFNLSGCDSYPIRNPNCGAYGIYVTTPLNPSLVALQQQKGLNYYPGDYAQVRMGGVDFNDPAHPPILPVCPGGNCYQGAVPFYQHYTYGGDTEAGRVFPGPGSFGGGGPLLPGGFLIGASSPPPTVQELAALAADAYKLQPAGSGQYHEIKTQDGALGFRVSEYANPDGSQIVIAPRGTTNENEAAHAYTVLADAAFAAGTPNLALDAQVNQLAQFLASVAKEHPNSQITLTGYSLGGGTAQIVGKIAKIQTVTFNSPGAEALLGSYTGSLDYLPGLLILTPSGEVVEYRTIGEAISLVGTHIGRVISVEDPSLRNVSVPFLVAGFAGIHSIDRLEGNLVNESEEVGVISAHEHDGYLSTELGLLKSIVFAAERGAVFKLPDLTKDTLINFDPGPGYGYSFAGDFGSPDFSTLDLPIYGEVDGWCLSEFTDDKLLVKRCSKVGHFDLDMDVDRIDFYPFDDFGNPIYFPDVFLFGLSVRQNGTLNATLTTFSQPLFDSVPSVPEPLPSALLCVAVSGVLLGLRRRTLGSTLAP